MKCYKCNGTGVYDIYNDCPVCNGTGEYDPNDKGFGLPHDWENTVWDTDIYLDDIDDWGVCKDCAIKDNCSHYKPCKRQCEDYEQEPQTNFEQITKSEESLAEWIDEYCDVCEIDGITFLMEECDMSRRESIIAWLKQPHAKE